MRWLYSGRGRSLTPLVRHTPVMSVYTITTATPTTSTIISTTTATTTTAVTLTTTATPTTTAPAVAVSPEAAPGWIEFCERHARASASDFAKAFCTYVSLNLPESARSNLSYRDFLRKFIESFCEHFESEYLRRTIRYAITLKQTLFCLLLQFSQFKYNTKPFTARTICMNLKELISFFFPPLP